MISASDYFKEKQRARNYHRTPTEKQKEYALQLGIDPTNHTFLSLSAAIDDAKESRFAALCKEYDSLDSDLQRGGRIIDLAEEATTLKTKDGNPRYRCGPCPECTDGGDDRFFVDTRNNLFACRQCDFKGGLAQLAAYVWKCSTWDAIDSLTGQSPRKQSVITTRKSTRALVPSKKPVSDPKPYRDFSVVCEASQAALRGYSGQAGRDYLALRGITRDAWEVNRVGLIVDSKRGPTVCFPHELMIDGKMQVVSLNRRFLDDSRRYAKYESAKQAGKKLDIPKTKHLKGGRWGLYRLAGVSPPFWAPSGFQAGGGARALIIVEGEVNGLSVWLAVRRAGWLIDVISVGAQRAFSKLAAAISEAAKPYEHLIIWADEASYALDASRAISHHAAIKALRSPLYEGKELDANDLLTIGVLIDFLERVLPSETLEEDDASRLLATRTLPDAVPSNEVTPGGEVATNDEGRAHEVVRQVLTAHTDGTQPLPITRPTDTQPVRPTTQGDNIATNDLTVSAPTGSNSLLALCAELCSDLSDTQQAKRWYLVCEEHYMHGDFTSLLGCLEAIRAALREHNEPNFPDLPPTRPNYDDCPDIAVDSPYHRFLWAARAVKLGHTEYLGEAIRWAGLITDRETREAALRKTERLTECDEVCIEQLVLL